MTKRDAARQDGWRDDPLNPTIPFPSALQSAAASALMALTIAILLAAAPALASSGPATATLSISSSAIPVAFAGENFTYQAVSSEPANWTANAAPYGVLTSSTLVQYAALKASPATGASTFKLEASIGASTHAYQNWTVETYSLPFIFSVPYFTPNVGDFYNYTFSTTGTGTLSLSGAPSWLTLGGSASAGWVSGTVASGSWTIGLTLNTSAGNFTQYWPLTTSQTVPTSVGFTCFVGKHHVTATVSVTGGYPAGCGNEGLFSGEYVLMSAGSLYGTTTPWTFANTGQYGYAITLTANVTTSAVTLWYYGTPNQDYSYYANGGQIGTVVMPAGGFDSTSYSPSYPSPAPGPGGCTGSSCGPSPPSNTTSPTSSCRYFCFSVPAVAAGTVIGGALIVGGIAMMAILRRGGWWFLGMLVFFAGVVVLIFAGNGGL